MFLKPVNSDMENGIQKILKMSSDKKSYMYIVQLAETEKYTFWKVPE